MNDVETKQPEEQVKAAQVTQVARRNPLQDVLGSTHEPQRANARLAWLKSNAHPVSPALSVATLPVGTELCFSAVQIEQADTYPVGGGKLGLGKSALDKIARAAGVTWDPRFGRTDDGKDPLYCAWTAVGSVRQFDGTEIVITGSVELDLRDGSPTVAGLAARARDGKSAANQLRDMRMYIVRHAESKARLRAIRSLGMRTSYTQEELQRPFVVVSLMWTGQTEDPALRKVFAEKTADHFLGARRALYGGAQPAQAQAPQLPAPPATRATPPADDELGFEGPVAEEY